MLKKILAILALLYAAASFAAVDANKATAAELDAVKGIGPVTSKNIVDERKKGEFKSWEDFITRVKGIGDAKATALSKEGLTVNGSEFKKAAAAKDAKAEKKEEKKEAKADTKAAAKDAKTDAKAETKEAKAEAKAEAKDTAKKDAKAEKAEKKEAKKKEAKAKAEDAKKDDKTAAAKPAAAAASATKK